MTADGRGFVVCLAPMAFKPRHRWGWGFASLATVAWVSASCAGTTPAADSPDDEASESEGSTSGPGAECIANANGKREKRPDEPVRIGLRHILVRHVGSKRPEGATRTREEACLRALEALKKLQATNDWDAVVSEYSDEKGAAGRHGSIGDVTRDNLDPDFADAAFELDVDELSYVVESASGFHIILRTN